MNTAIAGKRSNEYTLHTSQVFSQAHLVVNFMGRAKRALSVPASTRNNSPAVEFDKLTR